MKAFPQCFRGPAALEPLQAGWQASLAE